MMGRTSRQQIEEGRDKSATEDAELAHRYVDACRGVYINRGDSTQTPTDEENRVEVCDRVVNIADDCRVEWRAADAHQNARD